MRFSNALNNQRDLSLEMPVSAEIPENALAKMLKLSRTKISVFRQVLLENDLAEKLLRNWERDLDKVSLIERQRLFLKKLKTLTDLSETSIEPELLIQELQDQNDVRFNLTNKSNGYVIIVDHEVVIEGLSLALEWLELKGKTLNVNLEVENKEAWLDVSACGDHVHKEVRRVVTATINAVGGDVLFDRHGMSVRLKACNKFSMENVRSIFSTTRN